MLRNVHSNAGTDQSNKVSIEKTIEDKRQDIDRLIKEIDDIKNLLKLNEISSNAPESGINHILSSPFLLYPI